MNKQYFDLLERKEIEICELQFEVDVLQKDKERLEDQLFSLEQAKNKN